MMSAYLVDPEHVHVLLRAAACRLSGQHAVPRSGVQRSVSGVIETIRTARDAEVRGGEGMVEAVDDGVEIEGGRIFELPDGFAVRALGTADSWNGFPVPILGLVEALRVCLHLSEYADLYLCSPLSDGGFAADGLQWQQRSTDLA